MEERIEKRIVTVRSIDLTEDEIKQILAEKFNCHVANIEFDVPSCSFLSGAHIYVETSEIIND